MLAYLLSLWVGALCPFAGRSLLFIIGGLSMRLGPGLLIVLIATLVLGLMGLLAFGALLGLGSVLFVLENFVDFGELFLIVD